MNVRFELDRQRPFDAEGLLGFLATRAIEGIEEVEGGVYRRSLRLAGGPAIAEVEPKPHTVEARLWLADEADAEQALAAISRLFDLDAEAGEIDRLLSGDGPLRELVVARPGKRVPGAVDSGEIVVRAVLGQQVSVAAGITQAARLVAAAGEPLLETRGSVTHVFPSMRALASLDPASLPMPRIRGRALIGACAALAEGTIDLSPDADPHLARAELVALPGIGPWTAEYVAMRALGDGDSFLATDLGVRRALEHLGLDGSPAAATSLAESWRPFRAYAQQYLWASLTEGVPG